MPRVAAEFRETEGRHQESRAIIYYLCPACAERPRRIVAPDCLTCQGTGHLRLGAAALYIYTPEVVAEAIEIGLSKAYSEETDRPGSIAAILETLTTAGVIHRSTNQQEKPLNMAIETLTAVPSWVEEWHQDNPKASAAGGIPEATPETIGLESGTATIRTYWQDGEPGHHLELPDTDGQLLSNSDLRALAEALQDIADEMQAA